MYHQKDEILGADGFKKFMKYEHCGYDACRYSKTSNHIHCIRPGQSSHPVAVNGGDGMAFGVLVTY